MSLELGFSNSLVTGQYTGLVLHMDGKRVTQDLGSQPQARIKK